MFVFASFVIVSFEPSENDAIWIFLSEPRVTHGRQKSEKRTQNSKCTHIPKVKTIYFNDTKSVSEICRENVIWSSQRFDFVWLELSWLGWAWFAMLCFGLFRFGLVWLFFDMMKHAVLAWRRWRVETSTALERRAKITNNLWIEVLFGWVQLIHTRTHTQS